jgi:hypothetical protein
MGKLVKKIFKVFIHKEDKRRNEASIYSNSVMYMIYLLQNQAFLFILDDAILSVLNFAAIHGSSKTNAAAVNGRQTAKKIG